MKGVSFLYSRKDVVLSSLKNKLLSDPESKLLRVEKSKLGVDLLIKGSCGACAWFQDDDLIGASYLPQKIELECLKRQRELWEESDSMKTLCG